MEKKHILWHLFWNFVKISSVSVGGGLTMIPLIEKYFTEPAGKLTQEDVVDAVAFGQSMPGIIAVNMSGFIGMRLGGVAGALAATFGVVIVPFMLIMMIAAIMPFLQGEILDHAFTGVRAGVAALILHSALNMRKKICKNKLTVFLAAAAFVLLIFTEINLLYLILSGGLAGGVHTFFVLRKAKKEEADK